MKSINSDCDERAPPLLPAVRLVRCEKASKSFERDRSDEFLATSRKQTRVLSKIGSSADAIRRRLTFDVGGSFERRWFLNVKI